MKKLFAFVLVLLLALPAYAGAEETPAAAETVLAQGDGYTLAYDATEFSFYLDDSEIARRLKAPVNAARRKRCLKALFLKNSTALSAFDSLT